MLWADLSDVESGAAPRARAFLIFAMLLSMGALAWSLFIMVDKFIDNDAVTYKWGGTSVFVSNMLLFISAWIMRVGTMVSNEYM